MRPSAAPTPRLLSPLLLLLLLLLLAVLATPPNTGASDHSGAAGREAA
jgi:hypothetical protein